MKKTDKKTISIYFLLIFGAALYLSFLFNDNLWVDEAFSASLIRGSWSEVWRDTVADTLPPLYNLFAKLMTVILGYSAPVMKFASAIPMILSLIVAAFPLRRLYGVKCSALFMLLLISMPELFYYGVEIRPYSLGFLFVTCAAASYCSLIAHFSKRSLTCLAVSTALAGYSHHFALVAAAFLWLWYFIYLIFHDRKHITDYFKGIAMTTAMYLPCFCLAVYQIKNYFSMAPLSLHSLLSDLRYPFVTHITALSLALLVCFVLVVICAVITHKSGTMTALSLIVIYAFVIGFGYGASILKGSSLFTARYFPSLGCLWLGFSIMLNNTLSSAGKHKKILSSIVLLIIIFVGLYNYRVQFVSEYAPAVNDMKDFFNNNLSPDDGYIIYEDAYQIETCMKYYYPNLQKHSWKNVDKIKGTVWYFEVDGYEKELEKASDYGYNIVYIRSMAFDRYAFRLYRLDPV